ncbi:hypothetical protein F3157_18375 [Virgibacillus dakarensis]|nr:hypothetical protein [Virgibacillus dakarensis]
MPKFEHLAVRSITKHRDQINAIKNCQIASILDINAFQERHGVKVTKIYEKGNIVLDPDNKADCLWLDDE